MMNMNKDEIGKEGDAPNGSSPLLADAFPLSKDACRFINLALCKPRKLSLLML